MKRLALLLALTVPTAALAHELVRDGDVGALLHIEPDDDPAVAKPNPTWFEVNQRGGKAVTTTNCACVLSVYAGSYRAGAKALSTPALKTADRRLGASVTFPKEGAYTLVLTGKAKAGATFRPFTLQFVVRAGGEGGGGEEHSGH
ncbi:hypothetical protein [Deinococcus pimensis]|uniref:hypothetical protein n=1 Tax=Deinococcus pimensis TaxID=309888 RepID=UPI000487C288|nr:hypothetical protein [Deinococcus pimensis]